MVSAKRSVLRYTSFASPFGAIGLVATDKGMCRLDLNVEPSFYKNELERRYTCSLVEDNGFFSSVEHTLQDYFQGVRKNFNVSIDFIEGTAFQRRVWRTLKKIPYGQVRSYAWVAKEVGHPRAVRAVGQANARNPVAIFVPCHRVINSDGGLGGYGSGLEVKKALLRLEGISLSPTRK